MSTIVVEPLSKMYPAAVNESELKGTLTHFFKRNYRQVKAVQDVSFKIESGKSSAY